MSIPSDLYVPTPEELAELRKEAIGAEGVLKHIARIMKTRPEMDSWQFDIVRDDLVAKPVFNHLRAQGWNVEYVPMSKFVGPVGMARIEVTWPKVSYAKSFDTFIEEGVEKILKTAMNEEPPK